MTSEQGAGPFTAAERDLIARARRLAFAGTGILELRAITGAGDNASPETLRAEALSEAQRLLLEMVVIAERLARPETGPVS